MRVRKQQQIAEIVRSPGEVQRGYLASWLVICTLPHSDPKTPTFTRTNGDCTLTIQSGAEKGVYIGLPYGALSRLLLFWLISEAYRTKSRRLSLGETVDGFVRAVGLDPKTGRGERGDATRLREQMRRLFACRISLERGPEGGGVRRLDMAVAPGSELWWDAGDPERAARTGGQTGGQTGGWVELGEDFYEAVTESPVPLDLRALVALKHSPMAMDLYAWLSWRVFASRQAKGRPAAVPLADLTEQIGSDYAQGRAFRAALAEGLVAVRQVWPRLDYALTATHLTVRRSPAPPRSRATRAVVAGYVYLLSDPYGNYKIGKALRPQERLARIAPRMPFTPTLEHWIPCEDYTGAERSLHRGSRPGAATASGSGSRPRRSPSSSPSPPSAPTAPSPTPSVRRLTVTPPRPFASLHASHKSG